MTHSEDKHSIDREPQIREGHFTPDDAEKSAARKLANEQLTTDPELERAKHSVFDEPISFPHREAVEIKQDWHCRNCHYNLRGLMTGHPCPECGSIERYEPPRDGEITYAKLIASRRSEVSSTGAWLVAVSGMLLGVPLALLFSFLLTEYLTLLFFGLIGPATAELSKIFLCAMLIERKSPYIKRPAHIYVMTIGTALLFALVQNWVCLNYIYSVSPRAMIAWRWTGCVALHMLCTGIAAAGLVRVWRRGREEDRMPSLSPAYVYIVVAIVIHAALNTSVMSMGLFGCGF